MPKELGDKLKKVNNQQNSAINNHRLMRYLLQRIGEFSPEQQTDLFEQTDENDNTILMVAIKDYREAVNHMLDCIEELNGDLLKKNLTQTNKCGENLLALAAVRDVELEARILNLIGEQEEGVQEAIWSQANSSINQADDITNSYLKGIDCLPKKLKEIILSEPDEKGGNKLMWVIQHNPRAVIPYLEHIDKLPKNTQRAIYAQINQSGDNVRTLAEKYAPNVIDPICKRMKKLHINNKSIMPAGQSFVADYSDSGSSPHFFRSAVKDQPASEDEEKKEFPPHKME